MKSFDLQADLEAATREAAKSGNHNPEVVLIVNGIAHPITDVWFFDRQGERGSICIGEDPR